MWRRVGCPHGCPLTLAAGLGPGAGAACVFSLSRHGHRQSATELRQPRSAESRVPACEVPLQCRFAINLCLSTVVSVCVIGCRDFCVCVCMWMFPELQL